MLDETVLDVSLQGIKVVDTSDVIERSTSSTTSLILKQRLKLLNMIQTEQHSSHLFVIQTVNDDTLLLQNQ